MPSSYEKATYFRSLRMFVPGLADAALIRRVAEGSPLPLNIMVSDKTPPLRELGLLGVARVSHGPRPYVSMMKKLEEAARDALGDV